MNADGDQPGARRGASSAGQPTRVLISNRQSLQIDRDGLVALALACLQGEGAGPSELSVSFVELEEMADLHVRYMGEPGPTDVLSFALDEVDEDGLRVLGDVVISPAFAAGSNPDLEAELRLLLVHGILHLLGHDHEDDRERAEMWALQERYAGVVVP